MTPKKLARINALARKAKAEGLTPEEIAERDILRREYINSVTGNLEAQLEHTSIQNEDGTVEKLKKKDE